MSACFKKKRYFILSLLALHFLFFIFSPVLSSPDWLHLRCSASFSSRRPAFGPRCALSDTLTDTAFNQSETFFVSVSLSSPSNWLLWAGPVIPSRGAVSQGGTTPGGERRGGLMKTSCRISQTKSWGQEMTL